MTQGNFSNDTESIDYYKQPVQVNLQGDVVSQTSDIETRQTLITEYQG